MLRGLTVGAVALSALTTGCLAQGWSSGATTVSDAQVAAALGSNPDATEVFDATLLPRVEAPRSVRPCCAFGMDLRVQVVGVSVPGYSQGNVIGTEDLGRHEDDNDAITLNERLTSLATVEGNGLVYTCRGGFVDIAHVRDNADLTLFLTMKIVAALPGPTVVTLPGDGATRRVVVKGVPPETMDRIGRWETAITLAQWAAFQISIWHEIVTFHGFESVPGFSEKVSAFSPEDLYSNALGARIAGGILRSHHVRLREEWDADVKAWIPAALRRLGVQDKGIGRLVMKSLDGTWWDSSKRLPDWTLVMRRKMDLEPRVAPWRREDANLPADSVVDAACSAHRSALPLDVPSRLGDRPITEIATVDFELGDWAPPALTAGTAAPRRIVPDDFPKVVQAIRSEMEKGLGAAFDRPGRAAPSAPRAKASPPG